MPSLKPKLEVNLVVFKNDAQPTLNGVQKSNWETGWKGSTAHFGDGGVYFSFETKKIFVPLHNMRQIEFKT
jgi:hypothetical protein